LIYPKTKCSVSLKTYAYDDTTLGSWMMGIQSTYIDDSRLCCSTISKGNIPILMLQSLLYDIESVENENVFG